MTITLQDLFNDRDILTQRQPTRKQMRHDWTTCPCPECSMDRLGDEIEQHPIGGDRYARLFSS